MAKGRIDYLKHLRYLVRKKSTNPFYLTYFITQRCTCHCGHCFIKNDFRKKDELTLDEIEKVSLSMNPFLFLLITGGEPFLRDDLPEIIRVFYTNNRVRKFELPTNCSLDDRVIALTKKTLDYIPEAHLGVTLSLDGIGKDHDRIRQLPGLFEKVVDTHSRLKAIKKQYANLNIQINVTISALNQDRLGEIYRYINSELDPDTIIYVVVRGSPRDSNVSEVNADKVEKWNRLVEQGIMRRSLGYKNFPFSVAMDIKNIIHRRMIIETLKEPKYKIPCYSGQLAGVMFSDGDVYPCEILMDKKLGNVRDVGYDFKKIWLSERARQVRKHIKKIHCYCTHECAYSTNILFNPRLLPLIFYHWLKIKGSNIKARLKAYV